MRGATGGGRFPKEMTLVMLLGTRLISDSCPVDNCPWINSHAENEMWGSLPSNLIHGALCSKFESE